MPVRRLANGGPYMKPRRGAHTCNLRDHLEQRLAAPPTGPKPRNRVPHDSVPGRPRPPERLKPWAAGSAPQAQSLWLGGLRAHQAQGWLDARFPSTKLLASVLTPRQLNPPSAQERPKPKRLEPPLGCPKNKVAGLADQRPDCLPGTTPTTPT